MLRACLLCYVTVACLLQTLGLSLEAKAAVFWEIYDAGANLHLGMLLILALVFRDCAINFFGELFVFRVREGFFKLKLS